MDPIDKMIKEYPSHFKIIDYLKESKDYNDNECNEIFRNLLVKVKSEKSEESFNNLWHESLFIFLKWRVENETIPKPNTNKFVFMINFIHFCYLKKYKTKAQRAFKELKDIDDIHIAEAEACIGYALNRLHANLYEHAFKHFKESARKDPSCGKVWLQLAKLHRKLEGKRDEKYKEYLQKASELLPKDEEVEAEYLEIKDTKILSRPISSIKNTSVLLKISNYYINEDRYEDAENILLKINSIRKQPMSFYYLALINSERNYISKAVDLDSLNPLICYLNALYLLSECKFKKAQQQLKNTKRHTNCNLLKERTTILLNYINYIILCKKQKTYQVSLEEKIYNWEENLLFEMIVEGTKNHVFIKHHHIVKRPLLKFALETDDERLRQFCFKCLMTCTLQISLQDLQKYTYDICFFTEYFSNTKKLQLFKNRFGLRISDNANDVLGKYKADGYRERSQKSLYAVICLSKDKNIHNFFLELIINNTNHIIVLTDDDVDIPERLRIYPHLKLDVDDDDLKQEANTSFVCKFFETIFECI